MIAAETTARARLMQLIEIEFAADSLTVEDDKIHDSLGQKGHIAGVYPGPSGEMIGNGFVLESTIYVQIFRQWDPRIDPTQSVSPGAIEEWAERFRRATRLDLETAGDAHLWYYTVQRIEYPPDPTGNITRLFAVVEAKSQNPSWVETTD